MKKRWQLLTILLIWAGGAAWLFREPMRQWMRSVTGGVELGSKKVLKPDPKTYAVLVSELARWRADLAKRHKQARTEAGRAAAEHDARVILEHSLPAMMRCWIGTPWDFNGTAAKPGGGKIACGYFVATVLQDAGFRVNRYQLAQQASENILRSFLAQKDCHLTVGQPYGEFAAAVGKADRGIHLVGLDTHVAFLVTTGDGSFRFIHSSGSRPWCVVDESPDEAGVLERSNWRMLGNLTADPGVLRHWLRGDKIKVRKGAGSP